MDERDAWPGLRAEPGDPGWDIEALIAEAGDLADYARWTLAWVDLSPESRAEVRRHAATFRDLGQELRDIVRGMHPGLDG
ncbi:MAG: hypothetical protein M3008_04395 [Chloroflexota bacterium]|nr:hypothetical protein [Chloroflexota bacterium]